MSRTKKTQPDAVITKVINRKSIDYRDITIRSLSDNMNEDLTTYSNKVMDDLRDKTAKHGINWFTDLLRISAHIPECIVADSSEEKRYSKFTDTLLAFALEKIGLISSVLTERADSADVIAENKDKSINLVGDAKAFRISRTAKNQKDFKVVSMNKWKNGRDHALLVCPIYQLPTSSSQIYIQAENHNVCIFTFSHLCVLLNVADKYGNELAQNVLKNVLNNSFSKIKKEDHSDSAKQYWACVNNAMIELDERILPIWEEEKEYIISAVEEGKFDALNDIQNEKNRIDTLTREQAIKELIVALKLNNKISTIKKLKPTEIMEI